MTRNSWLRTGALAASLLAGGCHGPMGELAGKASDECKTVEVRAERSARAVTDEAARELVSKIAINEEVTPDRVAIRTEGVSGLLIDSAFGERA